MTKGQASLIESISDMILEGGIGDVTIGSSDADFIMGDMLALEEWEPLTLHQAERLTRIANKMGV